MSDPSTKRTAWRSLARRAAAALGAALLSISAHAVPGQPGIPSAPIQLYLENFENRPNTGVYQVLNGYTGGAAALSSTYSADAYWLQANQRCNGIVAQAAIWPSFPCTQASAQQLGWFLAEGMGMFHGVAVPTNETVLLGLSDLPAGGGASNLIQFQSLTQIPINGAHFHVVGVDTVTSSSCQSPARLLFYFIGPANQVYGSLNATATSTCAPPTTGVRGGVFLAKSITTPPAIVPGPSVRLLMRNSEAADSGNDTAFDNFRLLDVTPQLDQQIPPGPLAAGAYGVNKPARMTFTIDPHDRSAAAAGMVVHRKPASRAGDRSHAQCRDQLPGNRSRGESRCQHHHCVSTGTLQAAPTTHCTVEVNVTSGTAGTYTSATGNVAIHGLLAPGSTSVTFVNEPVLRLQKALGGNRVQAGDQFTLNITSAASGSATATTTGSGAAVTSPAAILNPGVTGAAYTLAEAAAGTTVPGHYASSYGCTNAAAGGQTPSGTGTSFSITPVPTDDLTCTFTNVPAATDLQVVKAAGAPSVPTGGVISFTLTVTNAGTNAANNAVLRDVPGAGLDCTAPSLSAPTCSASGGASCPGGLTAANLTSPTGVAIPALPAGGSVVVAMQCVVTATGLP